MVYWLRLEITSLGPMVSLVPTVQATQGRGGLSLKTISTGAIRPQTVEFIKKIPTAQQGNSGSHSPLSKKEACFFRCPQSSFNGRQ